jgi:replication factor C subunit 3/5
MDTTPWVEKYRPTKLENIILDDMNKEIFKNVLEKQYFPNLLFYGPPGTGKTTSIINLINSYQDKHYKIDNSLVIHLNASDDRGIDIIRNQIQPFVKSSNFFQKGLKFVILDEVDYMTKSAQQALKYLLQACENNVRFCLICNYICKVDDSLQNEFLTIRFNQLPESSIHDFIQNIAYKEGLDIKRNTIQCIQKMYGSDIRSIINFIQLNQNIDFSKWGKHIINDSVYKNIHDLFLSNHEYEEIKQHICDKCIQYNMDKKMFIIEYFNYLFKSKQYLKDNVIELAKEISHNNIGNTILLNYFISEMHGIVANE